MNAREKHVKEMNKKSILLSEKIIKLIKKECKGELFGVEIIFPAVGSVTIEILRLIETEGCCDKVINNFIDILKLELCENKQND